MASKEAIEPPQNNGKMCLPPCVHATLWQMLVCEEAINKHANWKFWTAADVGFPVTQDHQALTRMRQVGISVQSNKSPCHMSLLNTLAEMDWWGCRAESKNRSYWTCMWPDWLYLLESNNCSSSKFRLINSSVSVYTKNYLTMYILWR